MNCEQFENLLADALGDELSAANRPAFEEHLQACERCRREYESTSAALSAMRALTAPPVAALNERADGNLRADQAENGARRFSVPWPALMRYAAAILIAFAAGYLYRQEPTPSATTPSVKPTLQANARDEPVAISVTDLNGRIVHASPRSFEAALAGAHLRNPAQSDLAKCMIAMFATRQ